VVGLTMVASLTLLPAMLGFLGPKVLRRAERRALAQQGRQVKQTGAFWLRWAEGLGRRPAIPAVLALAVIVILALPVLSFRTGLLDASTDPPSSTTYQAYQLLAKGFGPGFNGPLDVVGQVNTPADRARFAAFVASARNAPGVAGIVPPVLGPDGKVEVAVVFPTTGPQEAATTTTLDRLRTGVPRAEAGSTLAIHIGGLTAANEDYSQVMSSKLPQFLAVVVGLAFLLLFVVFRSLLIPLVASILNVLSFGVALGVMTAAFQFGWGKSLLGFGQAGPTEAWIPALMFAVLFGLSTDYEVFLISRMHEEWTLTGDNKRAVIRGQAETGRVITAASLIMILVFASFIIGGQMPIQQIGLGFAAAIFVDAYLIRTVLVPSVMHMLGRANWWLPAWLDRRLPRLHVEPAELTTTGPLREPTGVGPHGCEPQRGLARAFADRMFTMTPLERVTAGRRALGHGVGAEKVDGQVPFEHGEVGQVVGPRNAGVVDQHVQGLDLVGGRLNLRRAGDVQAQGRHPVVWVGQRLERLAVDSSGRECPAAEHERQVFGLAPQRRPRSVGPVKVGGLQAAPLDTGAEVLMHVTPGEVVQDDPDGAIR
jgi:putative drug exporter of the RND superfamily